jgi:hypothetical protein
MLRKLSVTAIAVALIAPASIHAQTEPAEKERKAKTTVSGFADAYFRSDFMKEPANNRTSFTNTHNSFEIGMASLKLEYQTGKVSMVADLGVGKRAQEFSYNETGLTSAIKQLYLAYAPSDWLKLTMGSWATHVGYEMVDAPVNRNYSMSYMFSWGPFFHTGLKAEATFGKGTVMLGVSNPTDFKTAPLNSSKYLIAQYAYAASDGFKAYLNYVGGKRFSDSARVNQFDLVVTAKVSETFNMAFNSTMAANRLQAGGKYEGSPKVWWGTALYLNADPSERIGLTLRSEYFSDRSRLAAMAMAPTGANIFANTLSVNLRMGELTLIPEFRLENATEGVYTDKAGNLRKGDASLLLAAVYRF